ncbi:hypothetical protein JCM11251_001909 [Rhodosporidiobolus azoricus]
MASPIVLVTSDDPPDRITISRAALLTNSRVFADMLDMPGAVETEIPLSETHAELADFLSVLEGGGLRSLHDLDEKQWETLARLGDKFDSEVVKGFVTAQACADSDLIGLAAVQALDMDSNGDDEELAALPEWQERLVSTSPSAFSALRLI